MVVIRLAPCGKKGEPVYKITVCSKAAKLTGKYIEKLGIYRPGRVTEGSGQSADKTTKKTKDEFTLKQDRFLHWVKLGAIPTPRLNKVLKDQGTFSALASEAESAPVAAAPAKKAKSTSK